MISFIVCLLMFVIGLALWFISYDYDWLGVIFSGIFGTALTLVLIIGVGSFFSTAYKAEEREALIKSIEAVTTNGEFEHLSLDQEIIDFNRELLLYQKQIKNPIINFGMSKKVLDVEPITKYRQEVRK